MFNNIDITNIKEYIESIVRTMINTTDIGQIIEYDPIKNTATIRVCIGTTSMYGTEYTAPKLYNIPLLKIQSSNCEIRFPDSELIGEYCILLYCKKDISQWKNIGGNLSQNSYRKFDINDAIAIYGINPYTKISESNDSLIINYKQSKLEIKSDGNINIESSGDVNILAENIKLGEDVKKLIHEEAASVYNDHGHIANGTPTSKPIKGTEVLPVPSGSTASKIEDSEMTTKTKAE